MKMLIRLLKTRSLAVGKGSERVFNPFIPEDGVYEYKIKLVDEPYGWQPRDKLIIASTDYDMNQAEEVEIVNCQIPCEGFCECTVQGELKYTHYGKIYKVFLNNYLI